MSNLTRKAAENETKMCRMINLRRDKKKKGRIIHQK